MTTFNVEFIYDYMCIIAHVQPDYETDVHDVDIIEMAQKNLLTEYGFDVEAFEILDVQVHEVG